MANRKYIKASCRRSRAELSGDDKDGRESTWTRFLFKEHNIKINYGEEIYFTLTYDGENNVNKIFVNGKTILTAPEREGTDVWNKFIQVNNSIKEKHIEVGREMAVRMELLGIFTSFCVLF